MLTDYGVKNGISIICENHGGPSSNPDAMVALMKAVGKPAFGTLPDFGNFPQKGGKYTIDVYDAIARMMPYAKGVSAKSYDFDESGKEKKLDFARIMKIVTDAGYHGFVGIEYEGSAVERARGHSRHQETTRIASGKHVSAGRLTRSGCPPQESLPRVG